MQGRAQFKAKRNDLLLPHMDEWSNDFDVCVFCSGADKLLKGLIIGRTAVRVAGTVLLDGADKDFFCAQNLGPADSSRKKVRIAERDVGDGDFRADLSV